MPSRATKFAQEVLSVVQDAPHPLSTLQVLSRLKATFGHTDVSMAEVHSVLESSSCPDVCLNENYRWELRNTVLDRTAHAAGCPKEAENEVDDEDGRQVAALSATWVNSRKVTIHYKCPSCGNALESNRPGTYVQCPSCNKGFRISSAKPPPAKAVKRTRAETTFNSPPPYQAQSTGRREHEREAMMRFNCPGCNVSFEKPRSMAGAYVQCAICGNKFHVPNPGEVADNVIPEVRPTPEPDSPSVNELVNARALVQEFWSDCTELQQLGITVSKVGMSAKIGGVGAGIGAGIAWDPLLGIALAIGGWLVDSIAEDYAEKKVREMRLKWHNVLSSLGPRQATLFAQEMAGRYPHLLPAVRQMLPGA